MGIIIFCIVCVIICLMIFGPLIGLIIGVPGCIIGLVVYSFLIGPETRHEEMMDEIRGIRDDIDDDDHLFVEKSINKSHLEINNNMIVNVDARSINIYEANNMKKISYLNQETIKKIESFLIYIKSKYVNIYNSSSDDFQRLGIDLIDQVVDDILFYIFDIKSNFDDLNNFTNNEKEFFCEILTLLKKFTSNGSRLNLANEKIVTINNIDDYLEVVITYAQLQYEDYDSYFPFSILVLYDYDLIYYDQINSTSDFFLTKEILSIYNIIGNEYISCNNSNKILKENKDYNLDLLKNTLTRWFNEKGHLDY